jgi:hypothetical protein
LVPICSNTVGRQAPNKKHEWLWFETGLHGVRLMEGALLVATQEAEDTRGSKLAVH